MEPNHKHQENRSFRQRKTLREYVIDQYRKVGGGNPTIEEIQNDEYAWSAVGMSAFMYKGDLPKDRFPYSQSHSTFIRKFIAARKVKDQKYAYWGYPLGLNDFVPEVGDLIAYARGKGLTPTKAAEFIDRTSAYDSRDRVAQDKGNPEVAGERTWITAYVEAREDWLANHDNEERQHANPDPAPLPSDHLRARFCRYLRRN
ncbi:DUF2272 domain-containing protein [Pseudomonas sp. DWP3-1-2]|uniref:DUF2272 domain-containing protein n=1 Tax=Pseudomonas sp. DWP3-1-2 TaxID=2804645 RepID=UPI003CF7EB1F